MAAPWGVAQLLRRRGPGEAGCHRVETDAREGRPRPPERASSEERPGQAEPAASPPWPLRDASKGAPCWPDAGRAGFFLITRLRKGAD